MKNIFRRKYQITDHRLKRISNKLPQGISILSIPNSNIPNLAQSTSSVQICSIDKKLKSDVKREQKSQKKIINIKKHPFDLDNTAFKTYETNKIPQKANAGPHQYKFIKLWNFYSAVHNKNLDQRKKRKVKLKIIVDAESIQIKDNIVSLKYKELYDKDIKQRTLFFMNFTQQINTKISQNVQQIKQNYAKRIREKLQLQIHNIQTTNQSKQIQENLALRKVQQQSESIIIPKQLIQKVITQSKAQQENEQSNKSSLKRTNSITLADNQQIQKKIETVNNQIIQPNHEQFINQPIINTIKQQPILNQQKIQPKIQPSSNPFLKKIVNPTIKIQSLLGTGRNILNVNPQFNPVEQKSGILFTKSSNNLFQSNQININSSSNLYSNQNSTSNINLFPNPLGRDNNMNNNNNFPKINQQPYQNSFNTNNYNNQYQQNNNHNNLYSNNQFNQNNQNRFGSNNSNYNNQFPYNSNNNFANNHLSNNNMEPSFSKHTNAAALFSIQEKSKDQIPGSGLGLYGDNGGGGSRQNSSYLNKKNKNNKQPQRINNF